MPRATRVRKRRDKSKSTDKTSPAVKYIPDGEVIEPSSNFLDYCILIYGESGIGKTSTCSKIPDSYIIQCDPNRKGLSARQTNIDNVSLSDLKSDRPDYTPWEQLVMLVDLICDDDTVKCVVVDNFGLLYEHAMRHRCYKLMVNDPGELNDYGQTWRSIDDMMTSLLNKLLYANKGIVLITHDTTKEVEMVSGNFERIEPAVMAAPFRWLKACTDFAFYMAYGDNGDRVFNLRGDKEIWLKCCTDEDQPRFHDPQGKPLRQISCGTSPKEAWQNLCKAWDNEIQDVDFKQKTKKSRSSRKILKE
jgi:phage nucleotide-binding protein